MRRRLLILGLIATDLGMALIAAVAATIMRFGLSRVPIVLGATGVQADYTFMASVIALIFPLAFAYMHLYDIDALFWGSGEFSRAANAVTLTLGVAIIAADLLNVDNISRLWLVYLWCCSIVLLVGGRVAFRFALHAGRKRARLLRPTLIIGSNADAQRMALSLEIERSSGLTLIGCLTGERTHMGDGSYLIPGVPIVGHVSELPDAVARLGADAVIIVSSALEQAAVSDIVSMLRRLPIDVHISSGLFDVLPARILVREVAGTPFMLVRSTSLAAHKLLMKRAFDIVFSMLILLAGLPLWLVIAVAIKFDSDGPLFYRQERVGQGGRLFRIFKFRSMCADAETQRAGLSHRNEADGPIFKMRNDPRVTRVGRFLRKYSLDEFPQFLNVLCGDMSIVGPRPPLPSEVAAYNKRHSKRLDVQPGITGLWQVSGRSDLTFDEMVRLDLMYIENWSLRFDLTLVIRTIPHMIIGDGAY